MWNIFQSLASRMAPFIVRETPSQRFRREFEAKTGRKLTRYRFRSCYRPHQSSKERERRMRQLDLAAYYEKYGLRTRRERREFRIALA